MKILISWIIILFNFFLCSDLEIEILVIKKEKKKKKKEIYLF